MKMRIWRLATGENVVMRPKSHLHEEARKFIAEALSRVSADSRQYVEAEVDLGRNIGQTICVRTTDADDIVYAKRWRRKGLSRLVRNRHPESCTTVFLALKKADEDAERYILMTAFIGAKAEPEPWDDEYFSQQVDSAVARQKAIKFWLNHALILQIEDVAPETITDKCPW